MDDKSRSGAREPNREVSRTTLTYVVLHPTALDPSGMSAVDVANHMEQGEFIGRLASAETVPVPAPEVDASVADMGGIEGFFADARTSIP